MMLFTSNNKNDNLRSYLSILSHSVEKKIIHSEDAEQKYWKLVNNVETEHLITGEYEVI